jgi:transposase-like protein
MTNEIKIKKEDIDKMLDNIKVTDDFNFNNLMNEITKQVIHSLVEGEMTDFIGFKKNQMNNSDNSRNGHNKKKVKTKTAELEVKILKR